MVTPGFIRTPPTWEVHLGRTNHSVSPSGSANLKTRPPDGRLSCCPDYILRVYSAAGRKAIGRRRYAGSGLVSREGAQTDVALDNIQMDKPVPTGGATLPVSCILQATVTLIALGCQFRLADTNLEGLSFVPCIELLSDTVMRLGGSSALDQALRRAVRVEPRFRCLGIGRGIGGSCDEAEFPLARSYGSRNVFGLPALRVDALTWHVLPTGTLSARLGCSALPSFADVG
ncbi:hypothetical protein R1flu_015820 [Riccia fluitans]|uniref:Uncharacterized protein n=1 Tax=Riccia fluitans TaxID=41844 RepID=A0ABD1YN76_9MARC